jgi:hypothetical protein
MQYPREMYDKGGLTSLKEARNLLEKHALPGESLAYINKEEARFLKYMGGAGIPINSSGIPSYFKKTLKKITKPIAKVLDKIVPNEIKPILPYVAAFTPMLAGAGFLGAGLSSLTPVQSALLGAGSNVIAQSAQEGAAKYGINPLSVGLASLSGYLSAPGAAAAQSSAISKGIIDATTPVYGNIPSNLAGLDYDVLSNLGYNVTQSGIPAGEAIVGSIPGKTSFLQGAENFARSVAKSGADFIGKGTDALSRGDIFSKDFAMAAIGPAATATGDIAYMKAQKALEEYDQQQAALGAIGVASTEARKTAIRRAMRLAGYTDEEIENTLLKFNFANGGRVGYERGGPISLGMELYLIAKKIFEEQGYSSKEAHEKALEASGIKSVVKEYGPGVKKAEGGIMDLGGKEMDLRAKGGFVPIGKKEKADDVPARLSKNEFVFTANAVRGAGKGDIRKGAKKMYQLMRQYEAMV